MKNYAFKLVCIDDSSPLEFAVLEDKNCGSLKEVYEYMSHNIYEHDLSSCKWLLLPIHKLKVG